jgi:SAM-dependent methyltransferase
MLLDKLKKWGSGRFKKSAFRAPEKPRLNLGCGSCFHEDWVNVDYAPRGEGVIRHNLIHPLAFADGSFTVVYHSHVLEHFPHAFAPVFLTECHRLLSPGGILRIAVPDLEMIARLYLKNLDGALAGDSQAALRYDWMLLELLDQLVRERGGGEVGDYWRQVPIPAEDFVLERVGAELLGFLKAHRADLKNKSGAAPEPSPSYHPPKPSEVAKFRSSGEVHKWMYDRWSLKVLLQKTGFVEINTCTARESSIPDFNRYLLDINPDGSVRKPDSLFMEARKP